MVPSWETVAPTQETVVPQKMEAFTSSSGRGASVSARFNWTMALTKLVSILEGADVDTEGERESEGQGVSTQAQTHNGHHSGWICPEGLDLRADCPSKPS